MTDNYLNLDIPLEERHNISNTDPEFYLKYFAAFRRDLRDILYSFQLTNPCTSDDEILQIVKNLITEYYGNNKEDCKKENNS